MKGLLVGNQLLCLAKKQFPKEFQCLVIRSDLRNCWTDKFFSAPLCITTLPKDLNI